MKKFIVPAILAAAAFCITYYFQTFTLLRQEGLGLYLNTPDFYREILLDPLPVSSLIGSFLVQFYCNHTVAVTIFTAMILAVYFLTEAFFRRISVKTGSNIAITTGTLFACAAWVVMANSSSPTLGVAIILVLCVVYMLTMLVSKKKDKSINNETWGIVAASLLILGTALFISRNEKIRQVEKWSKVEFAAIDGNWNYLLKVATPREAKKDPELSPFALLALNAKGELTLEKMSKYPLGKNFGLDYGDIITYRRCLFDAVLYTNLGCPNEAVHRTFQSGDFLYHGTSFRTLRMLVKENYAASDSLMVVKYCDILDKSLTHGRFVRYFRDNPCPQRPKDSVEERIKTPMTISKDQMETMLQLGRSGINSGMAMERYYGYFKLKEYFENH